MTGENGYEVIDDADLEVLLETYHTLQQHAKRAKVAMQRIKEMLPSERTEGKTLQIGRFKVSGNQRKGGKEVSFTTGPSYAVRVTVVGPR